MGVFGSDLSNEYLLAAKHFGLGRKELVELCYGTVEVIFGGEQEMSRIRSLIKAFEVNIQSSSASRDGYWAG